MYTWHVTFDDQPVIHDLAARYQERLADLTGLDLIPAKWLHLTTQGVGFTDDVSAADIETIINATRERLTGLLPVAATLGPAVVTPEAILLEVAPLTNLRRLRDELRAAISSVLGPERLTEGADWAPHVSVAYSHTTRSADEYVAAVDGSTDTAKAVLNRVQLIILGRDERMYEWTARADVPLGLPARS